MSLENFKKRVILKPIDIFTTNVELKNFLVHLQSIYNEFTPEICVNVADDVFDESDVFQLTKAIEQVFNDNNCFIDFKIERKGFELPKIEPQKQKYYEKYRKSWKNK